MIKKATGEPFGISNGKLQIAYLKFRGGVKGKKVNSEKEEKNKQKARGIRQQEENSQESEAKRTKNQG